MTIQTTPHTQTQQNQDPTQSDLEAAAQTAQDSDQDGDEALYENADGAQTGGTRAFHANAIRSKLPNTEPRTAALDGGIDTRTPESEDQGITNHSASEESARQRKVVSERPDSLAGVNQTGHVVPK